MLRGETARLLHPPLHRESARRTSASEKPIPPHTDSVMFLCPACCSPHTPATYKPPGQWCGEFESEKLTIALESRRCALLRCRHRVDCLTDEEGDAVVEHLRDGAR